MHLCVECGTRVATASLRTPVSRLAERIVPGHPAPSGECPDCGGLCIPAWATLPNQAPLTRWEKSLQSGLLTSGPLREWECHDLAALLQLLLERLAAARDHLRPRFYRLSEGSKIFELCQDLDQCLFALSRAQTLLAELRDMTGRREEENTTISEWAS